jgi:peptidoglycan/LPS O-acetylase OafA/YrhL
MVLVGHVFVFLPYGLLLSLLHFSTNALQISLDLFFVLSGFLITAILIRTREDRAYFRNFYIRRVLRIFPIYYLLLVFCFFVRPLLPGGAPPWQQSLDKEAAWFFLYAQNLAMAWRGEGIGWGGLLHTFSLAIEEQFYLLWPLLVWLVPLRRLLHVCLAVIAASLTYKTWMWLNGASWWYLYVDTLTRVHALAAGGAVAAWLIVHKGTMPRWLPAAALVAIVSIPFIIVAAAMGAISNIDFIVLLNDVAPVLFVWMLMSLIMSPPQQPLRRFSNGRSWSCWAAIPTACTLFTSRFSMRSTGCCFRSGSP